MMWRAVISQMDLKNAMGRTKMTFWDGPGQGLGHLSINPLIPPPIHSSNHPSIHQSFRCRSRCRSMSSVVVAVLFFRCGHYFNRIWSFRVILLEP
eukprot:8150505-Karenia_brevis.AAC.1